MEDLNYFYSKDQDGNVIMSTDTNDAGELVPELRPRLTSNLGRLEYAICNGLSMAAILDICARINDKAQWRWYDEYQDWLILSNEAHKRAAEVEPSRDADGVTHLDNWIGGESPATILAAIPDTPTRPEDVPYHVMSAPFIRPAFVRDRAAIVADIVVTVNGLSFDGHEDAQNRMARAIVGMDPDEEMKWTLHDNTSTMVTPTILRSALRLAGSKTSEVWHR